MVLSHRFIAAAVVIGLGAVALAGCSAAPDAVDSQLTIIDSKGSSQLVRNLAVEDVLAAQVGRLGHATTSEAEAPVLEDSTVACLSAANDPDGLKRWWRSAAVVTLADPAAGEETRDALVDDFVERGWTAGELTASGTVQFERDDSNSKVFVGLVPKGGISELTVTVDGPCVDTAGADSEEVLRAEGRWEEDE